ncbi:MAG: glycosyltransferase, partial [Candidatus Auribacterota bacterium]|nr:glycosyltransferase [Candidatus Auribacterota bacterium]
MTRSNTDFCNLVLFFTWDVSLELWEEKGLLQREILYYTRLAEQGVQVYLLTWGSQKDLEIARRFHDNIQVIPLYCYIPAPKNKIFRAILSPLALWVARSTLRRSNIIKTNQMWGGWIAVLAKFFFCKPLLVRTGFELYRFTCLQSKSLFRRVFMWGLSMATYKSANLIYLATEEDKDFVYRTFSIPRERIMTRPNWIDTEKFAPQTQIPSSSLNLSRILFVGRLNEQKNIPLLIEAVAGTE